MIEDTDEKGILASLGSTVTSTSNYESNIIREATLQLAPRLSNGLCNGSIGFPDLTSLLPENDKKKNLSIICNVLERIQSNIQREQEKMKYSKLQQEQQHQQKIPRLIVQQQMLFHLLLNKNNHVSSTTTATTTAARRKQEATINKYKEKERRLQEKYCMNLVPLKNKGLQIGNEQEKSISLKVKREGFGGRIKNASCRPRIPMMKRKRMELESSQQIDAQPKKNNANRNDQRKWNLRKERLKTIRKQRQKVRRQQWSSSSETSSNSDTDEEEITDIFEQGTHQKYLNNSDRKNNSNNRHPSGKISQPRLKNDSQTTVSSDVNSAANKATCCLCSQEIDISDSKNLDEELAKHMASCQQTTRRIRRTCTMEKIVSNPDLDEISDDELLLTEKGNNEMVVPNSDSGESNDDELLVLDSKNYDEPKQKLDEIDDVKVLRKEAEQDNIFFLDASIGDVDENIKSNISVVVKIGNYASIKGIDEINNEHIAVGNIIDNDASIERINENSNEAIFVGDKISKMKKRKLTTSLSSSLSKGKKKKKKKRQLSPQKLSFMTAIDDFNENDYEDRVDDWIEHGLHRMVNMEELRDDSEIPPGAITYDGGLYIPEWINNRLFTFQRTALQWMWDLHQQEAGGVLGDEMGLGKTVQISSFLGVMAAAREINSILIVSPATILRHWAKELATWAPGLRRIVIHSSVGNDTANTCGADSDLSSRKISKNLLNSLNRWLRYARNDYINEPLDEDDLQSMDHNTFVGTGYVVITTYETIRRNIDVWTNHNWSYVILDEAQKIRNPDADITLACKRLRTPHRIAITGTPIQNDLRELWSILDFVFPGRLGTLPTFEVEFNDPIRRGGYSNASPTQVQVAYRCALVLRDLINPYLLRRQKRDVKEVSKMPGKSEQVLFCRLSKRQRGLYESYLMSDEVKNIKKGTFQLFAAVTKLRKICNHPDLICSPEEDSYEAFNNMKSNENNHNGESHFESMECDEDATSLVERAGKLEVLSRILPLWHKQGHRVLIFCQWKKMLNIIQTYVTSQGWKFGRLDGDTNVSMRQKLVDTFNSDEEYFGMLLTTKTGGVGLNLIGANRIILYDPDWNPQTDAQARERAFRFGQKRKVTIYRLITAGTIEEKIYQRQIFKTALSNKVLQDPRQRRLFSRKDLSDLLSLKADNGSVRSGRSDGYTETGQITKGAGVVNIDDANIISTDDNNEIAKKDNEDTLKKVLRSKGLAGVFDHQCVEDNSFKTMAEQDMEKEAKRIAKEAADALKESVKQASRFKSVSNYGNNNGGGGNWGYSATNRSNFGSGINAGVGSSFTASTKGKSSISLLNDLRQQNADMESMGNLKDHSGALTSTKSTKKYAILMNNIRDFVKKEPPTTDDLLRKFSSIPSNDAAIFRRLLKSVAKINNGRWYLRSEKC